MHREVFVRRDNLDGGREAYIQSEFLKGERF